jgi:hypothetical protein
LLRSGAAAAGASGLLVPSGCAPMKRTIFSSKDALRSWRIIDLCDSCIKPMITASRFSLSSLGL